MRISLIVAVAENGVIGRHNDLPWRLSADLKRFKRLTMGHPILLGRKTYEAIGRPLPGRHMVVISRGAPDLPAQVAVVPSLEAGLEKARRAGDAEAFIAGGAQIYRLALPHADRIYLTRIHREFQGDTVFPEIELKDWTLVEQEDHGARESKSLGYSFLIFDRPR